MDPGAVLDFLTACIHIPRLWQGRDQNPAKHQQLEDVLDLSPACLQVAACFIIPYRYIVNTTLNITRE